MKQYFASLRGAASMSIRPSRRTTVLKRTRWNLLSPAIAAAALLTVPQYVAAQTAASPDFFEINIRPVLANHCYSCHASTAMSGLRLDSRDALIKGGSRGAAIVPGDPDK